MADGLNARHVRSTTSTGTNAPEKRDGYAAGTVPKCMQGTKPGKSKTASYSGPNVARASR